MSSLVKVSPLLFNLNYEVDFDVAVNLFEHLQVACIEPSLNYPDIVSFAEGTTYVGAITRQPYDDQDWDSERYTNHAPHPRTEDNGRSFAPGFGSPHHPPPSYEGGWGNWTSTHDPSQSLSGSTILPFRSDRGANICGLVFISQFDQQLSFEPGRRQYSIGIVLDNISRGLGIATFAVGAAVEHAFRHLGAHRVTASLINTRNHDGSSALALFSRLHFRYEGTHNHAYFSELEQTWKDVTVLAILDTDRVLYPIQRPRQEEEQPLSLWDIMFLRHQREREQLLIWDNERSRADRRRMRGSSSMETLRDFAPSESDEAPSREYSPNRGRCSPTATCSTPTEPGARSRVPSPTRPEVDVEVPSDLASLDTSSSSFPTSPRPLPSVPVNYTPRSVPPARWLDISTPDSSDYESDSFTDPGSSSGGWDVVGDSDSDAESFTSVNGDIFMAH